MFNQSTRSADLSPSLGRSVRSLPSSRPTTWREATDGSALLFLALGGICLLALGVRVRRAVISCAA
jgi:hypothetical protein